MNKSPIEWTEFTANPVRGKCPVGCPYCYVNPLRRRYGWHEDIRYYPQVLESIRHRKKPSRIFVGSTIELFHDDTVQYMPEIMETARACPQHTLMFLTKQPQNLKKFSPFPGNCWVGVSATNAKMADDAGYYLHNLEAKVKYLSIEPLLERMQIYFNKLDWVIIGAQTKPTIMPKIEWVQEIVDACDNAGVKVFLKDSLSSLWEADSFYPEWAMNKDGFGLRQEIPLTRGKGG